jgi:hypothetical protein
MTRTDTGRALRPTFAVVAENTVEWLDRAFSVALSVRRLGGPHARAPVVVHVVDGVDRDSASRLLDLGALVRPVERVDPEYPYANKLRMFEHGPEPGTDVLVGLDCDTVVVGDVSPFLSADAVGAKPADCDFLTEGEWRRVFSRFEIPPPPRNCRTTTLDQQTYPYFNSGVLVVPASLTERLATRWWELILGLGPLRGLGHALGTYTDQVALACALTSAAIPVRHLPVSMNFPAHLNVHRAHLSSALPPRIIHYHASTDARGFLLPTKYPQVNRLIKRFNLERADQLAISWTGLPRRRPATAILQELRSRSSYYSGAGRTLRTGAVRLLRRS